MGEIKPPHDENLKRFQYQCPDCGNFYIVRIQVDLYQMHRVACPFCREWNFFDNRAGQLNAPKKNEPVANDKPLSDSLQRAGAILTPSDTPPQTDDPNFHNFDSSSLTSFKEPSSEESSHQPSDSNISYTDSSVHDYKNRIEWRNLDQKRTTPNHFTNFENITDDKKKDTGTFSSYLLYPFKLILKFFLLPIQSIRSLFSRSQSSLSKASSSIKRSRSTASSFIGTFKFAMILIVAALILLTLFIPITMLFPPPGSDRYLEKLTTVHGNRILDRNGELIAELFSKKTGRITEETLPDSLKSILIFVEDENFYNHGAIHYPSLIRAAIKNFFSFGYSQGGSTITQQLARILLDQREKTLIRKWKEASLAYHLERKLSKDQILIAYMNHVYLGHGATGMDTAAEFYFNKELKKLSFVEQLVLASLPSAPARYSPIRNPNLLQLKMDAVFKRMKQDDFTKLSEKDYETEKIKVLRGINRSPSESVFGTRVNDAPFVSEYVRQFIKEKLGEDYMYDAGIIIETTIDAKYQRAAVKQTLEYIKSVAPRFRPVHYRDNILVDGDEIEQKIAREYFDMAPGAFLFGGIPQPRSINLKLQSASIGIHPATGEVLFMHGGTEFTSGNQLNRSIQMRRQTGSAIKPIIYSAGIETGVITAASPLDDTPLYAPAERKRARDKGYWLPGNITGIYEGEISARKALANSKNVPAIRVGQKVGLSRLKEQFRKFFFYDDSSLEKRFRSDDTIAIGTLEMSPLEMALAFSVFGNNGVMNRPYLIKKIVSETGKTLYDGTGKDEFGTKMPESHQVLSGDVAEVIASMMSDAAHNGGVAAGGFRGAPLIGKTGTTNDFKDAWFVGVIPGLSAAVWVGYDHPSYSMLSGTGAGVAGPLWGRIVSAAGYHQGEGFVYDPPAVKISVCAENGLLPCRNCRQKIVEYFALAHRPTESCDILETGKKDEEPTSPEEKHQESDFQ